MSHRLVRVDPEAGKALAVESVDPVGGCKKQSEAVVRAVSLPWEPDVQPGC